MSGRLYGRLLFCIGVFLYRGAPKKAVWSLPTSVFLGRVAFLWPLGDVNASGLFFIFGVCFSGAMPCAGNVGQSKNCSNVVSVVVFADETSELNFFFEEGGELVDVATSGPVFIFAMFDVETSELFFLFEEGEEEGVGNVCPISVMVDVGASETFFLFELVDVVASVLFFI
jgi:hypothetical protein